MTEESSLDDRLIPVRSFPDSAEPCFKREELEELWPIHPDLRADQLHREDRAKLQASIERCNFILNTIRPDSNEARPIIEQLLRSDPNLCRYLQVHEGDPSRALVAARADAVFLATLEGRNMEGGGNHQKKLLGPLLLERLLIPIALVLCTAVAGNYVADSLQRSAFERQKNFEARLEDAREARTRSAKLVSDVDDALPFIKARERYGGKYDYREKLRSFSGELAFLAAISEGFESRPEFSKSVSLARASVNKYLSCMEDTYKSMSMADESAPCSEDFDRGSIEAVRRSASRLASAVGQR